MVRIFLSLSIFALLFTAVTSVVGLSLGDLKSQLHELKNQRYELTDLRKQSRVGQGGNADTSAKEQQLEASIAKLEGVVSWSGIHRLLGIATALVIIFVNSVSVTYFVGTSRWVKEVCETYPIDQKPIVESTLLKRSSFPWAVTGMLTAVVISAFGAAGDPSTGNPNSDYWVDYHLAAALGGIAALAYIYYQQWSKIYANHQVIGRVLADVKRVREERRMVDEES